MKSSNPVDRVSPTTIVDTERVSCDWKTLLTQPEADRVHMANVDDHVRLIIYVCS